MSKNSEDDNSPDEHFSEEYFQRMKAFLIADQKLHRGKIVCAYTVDVKKQAAADAWKDRVNSGNTIPGDLEDDEDN